MKVLILISTTVFLGTIAPVTCLECYVCTRQEGNVEKCLSTVKTCQAEEDICQTELRWGSTPYWNQVAEKQYYVTKRCAKAKECDARRQEFMSYCHRIWYEDWKCAECCQGDRCNYFIMMGASNLKTSWILFLIPVVMLFAK